MAASRAGIAPRDALEIFEPLKQARSHFVLQGGFHAAFLVTPPSSTASMYPAWTEYDDIVHALFTDYPVIWATHIAHRDVLLLLFAGLFVLFLLAGSVVAASEMG